MVLPKTKRMTKSANTTDAGGKFVGLGALDSTISFTCTWMFLMTEK